MILRDRYLRWLAKDIATGRDLLCRKCGETMKGVKHGSPIKVTCFKCYKEENEAQVLADRKRKGK